VEKLKVKNSIIVVRIAEHFASGLSVWAMWCIGPYSRHAFSVECAYSDSHADIDRDLRVKQTKLGSDRVCHI